VFMYYNVYHTNVSVVCKIKITYLFSYLEKVFYCFEHAFVKLSFALALNYLPYPNCYLI